MPENILITGATSKVGMALVRRFLERTDAHLWLLIRKLPEERDIKRRFLTAFTQSGSISEEILSERTTLLAGDLNKRGLGLSDDHFSEMEKSGIDEVFHFAALSDRSSFNKDQLLATNYHGTLRLLNLANRVKAQTFNHLSWLYAGHGRAAREEGEYLEFFDVNSDFNNLNEFVQQMTSHLVVKQCESRGLNYRILSPGYFLDFEFDPKLNRRWYYHVLKVFFDLVAAYREVGASPPINLRFPARDVPIHLTTPSYTADIFFALYSERENTRNRSFLLFNESRNVRDLFKTIESVLDVNIELVEKLADLPFIEKKFIQKSLIFFEYLLRRSSFPKSIEINFLEKKYQIQIPRIDSETLGTLIRNSYKIYQLEGKLRSLSAGDRILLYLQNSLRRTRRKAS